MNQNVYSNAVRSTVVQPLYDRELLLSGVTTIDFFSVQRGAGVTSAVGVAVDSGRKKTDADTNLYASGGQIGSNRTFTATALCISVEAGSSTTSFVPAKLVYPAIGDVEGLSGRQADDMRRIIASADVKMRLGSNNEYIRAPLSFFPPNVGLSVQVGGMGAGDTSLAIASATQVGQVYDIGTPIVITDAVPFGITIDFGSTGLVIPSGNIARVTCYLVGSMSTGAQ